jgi:hypothetical protein
MCDVDGTEDVRIKVEDTIDIKEEDGIKVEEAEDIKEEVSIKIEEAIDIKAEHEVRLWGVCEVVAAHSYRPFIAPPPPHKKKEIVKLRLTISCFMLYCGCHIPFEIWNAILMRRDFLKVIDINGRIILNILK